MNKIKGILYSGVLAALVMMAGCSSDRTGDVRGLLQTIPSDASAVTVIDLKSVLEKAGCEVDGSEVKPGKEIVKALDASGNAKAKDFFTRLQDGGVDPSVAALFIEGYNTYFAGFVADTDKFKAFVEKQTGGSFQAEGDVDVCGNTAIAGDRFWVCTGSNNTINANDVKHFVALSEKQSILSNEIAAGLEDLENDVKGWGDIKGCLNSLGFDFTERATVTMAIEAMFADAVEFAWELDLEKGKLEADMTVLNSKGGVARFNFPTAKIDAAAISGIGGTGEGFMALAVSPDMVKKLKEETGGKGFSMIGMLVGIVSCVDGTCGAAFSYAGGERGEDGEDGECNVRGVISTTGHGTSDLSDALAGFGYTASKEGKILRFGKGEVTGGLSAADAAEALKGSLAGMVFSGNTKILPSEAVSSAAITFKPEKGGLQAEIKVKGKDKKKNILLSLIESASEQSY